MTANCSGSPEAGFIFSTLQLRHQCRFRFSTYLCHPLAWGAGHARGPAPLPARAAACAAASSCAEAPTEEPSGASFDKVRDHSSCPSDTRAQSCNLWEWLTADGVERHHVERGCGRRRLSMERRLLALVRSARAMAAIDRPATTAPCLTATSTAPPPSLCREEKNYTPWAHEHIKHMLLGTVVENMDCTAAVVDVTELKGDVRDDACRRKPVRSAAAPHEPLCAHAAH